ncbi:hypothetical protein A3K82_02140 [Candidatus Pacearchaeota archaeon RBG_19FT_COMBO_34_9]|nr:MAG: hypothetical protein A3K82_02140 [Candidatus Pacearchaeota archaeon RBG_19FT_COMBO_34_9]OGJ16085.1 MAG: hypothetical protein A3K74_02520 [Candidatus Pacearchaeota archaeon RBG_13_33_26]
MKKEVVVLFLLGILFILPIISAQEQTQTYSGFDRFIDNAKMFFTFGKDGKVALSLEIREKEVNSAIINTRTENNEEAEKNLERAWEKLQFIQEKVSLNTAGEIKESSSEVLNVINQEENLSENFEVYSLEEEKTGLTAEWVIEVNGKEGQNLSNEVVVNWSVEQDRTMEIENRIDVIDNEISNWVVEHTYAEGTTANGESGVVVEGGLVRVVKTEVAQGDNGLKPEVKTYVAGDMTQDNKVVEGNGGEGDSAPGTVAGGDSTDNSGDGTNEVVEGDGGEGDYAEGTTADGGAGDSGDSSESSSGEGGGESAPTGEAIKEINSEDNSLTSFFKRLFGR